MPPAPLVSVIVPAYNTGAMLRETLESALGQSYSPLEVIVVDDGSTDDTPQIAAEFGRRIDYLRQDNQGGGAARNRGLRAARGEFIAFLDHDDLWHPSKIERQLALARQYPDSGLFVCDGRETRGHEVISNQLIVAEASEALGSTPGAVFTGWLYDMLIGGNVIGCFSQTLIPRKVIDAVGPLSTARDEPYDYEYHLRIALRHPITLHRDQLVEHRYLPGSRSGPLERRNLTWAMMDIPVLERQLRLCPEKRQRVRSRLRARVSGAARDALRYGRIHDRAFAIGYLERLLERMPSYRVAIQLARLRLPQDIVRPWQLVMSWRAVVCALRRARKARAVSERD